MGIECELDWKFSFIYKAFFENGLTEHEFDHVFIGCTDQIPDINPLEVKTYEYLSVTDIRKRIGQAPNSFTPWFKLILEESTRLAIDL